MAGRDFLLLTASSQTDPHMTMNRTRMTEEQPTRQQQAGKHPSSIADLVERLSQFDGPPEQFLVNLLAVQCLISWAAGGCILRSGGERGVEVLAVYPPLAPNTPAPAWLSQAVEALPAAMNGDSPATRPIHSPDDLYGAPAQRHLVLLPLRGDKSIRGMAAFVVETGDAETLAACRQRLELTLSLLSLYEMRLTLQHRQFDLRRLRLAMEVLSAVNENARFAGSAMSLCNEISSRWQCHRVALGFLKGRYVQLKGLSHTEKFSRKMKLIQDIEGAMEECLDQDVEVVFPPLPQATYVSRATGELSKVQGPSAIVSLPLRRSGEVIGVLTLERPLDKPFGLEEVEALRLAADLCTARLNELYLHDRWIGAKAALAVRKGLSAAVGPKHTWIKVAGILVCALIVFLLFAKGDYQAEGTFALESPRKQMVAAPFDGAIMTVSAEVGDKVEENAVLATMRTNELDNKLKEAQVEFYKYDQTANAKKAGAASARGADRDKLLSEADQDRASADGAAARVRLLEDQIAQAHLKAPIQGIVASGIRKENLNMPVKTGDPLFEICCDNNLRAEISVPEDQVGDVKVGQKGELATADHPERRVKFVVERINPVAEMVNQKNVFKVRVALQDVDIKATHAWLKPGREGIAKITIDSSRSYGWLWTYQLVNWVRMKLWL